MIRQMVYCVMAKFPSFITCEPPLRFFYISANIASHRPLHTLDSAELAVVTCRDRRLHSFPIRGLSWIEPTSIPLLAYVTSPESSLDLIDNLRSSFNI